MKNEKKMFIVFMLFLIYMSPLRIFTQDIEPISDFSFAEEKFIKKLELDDFISEKIYSDTSHIFNMFLEKNTFLFFIVQQLGVDLQIEILNQENEILKRTNHQSSSYGPEQTAFTSMEESLYRIIISTVSRNDSGNYQISVLKKQKAAETESQRIDELFAFYDRKGHPGASVCVVQDGKIVHSAGYGIANLALNKTIDNETGFHIGSETKQFTAFAVASLIFNKKIHPEDDIRKYLPELPWLGDTVRLKHLLNHTSGIREIYDDITRIAGWEKGMKPLEAMKTQKKLNFKPGEQYSYCNTEYGLLREIFERIEQTELSVWLQQNVFKKLGMKNSFFFEGGEKVFSHAASGYYINNRGEFVENPYFPAGIISTCEDLSKWVMNYEKKIAGNEMIFRLMNKTDTLNNGDYLSYTFGQEKIMKDGITFWGHGGGFQGFKSYILRCPEKHFAAIVLSNFDYFNNWFMARRIAEIYLNMNLTEEKISKQNSKPIQIASELKRKYCGTYWFNHDLAIQVELIDSNLFTQVNGQPKLKINLHDDGKFYYEKIDASIEFFFHIDNSAKRIKVFQNNDIYEGSKNRPKTLSLKDLEKYSGKYYCDEIETIYTIENIDSAYLTAEHPKNDIIKLYHFREHQFKGDKWFFKYIEFDCGENGITGFNLSTDRVKNLYFKKL